MFPQNNTILLPKHVPIHVSTEYYVHIYIDYKLQVVDYIVIPAAFRALRCLPTPVLLASATSLIVLCNVNVSYVSFCMNIVRKKI